MSYKITIEDEDIVKELTSADAHLLMFLEDGELRITSNGDPSSYITSLMRTVFGNSRLSIDDYDEYVKNLRVLVLETIKEDSVVEKQIELEIDYVFRDAFLIYDQDKIYISIILTKKEDAHEDIIIPMCYEELTKEEFKEKIDIMRKGKCLLFEIKERDIEESEEVLFSTDGLYSSAEVEKLTADLVSIGCKKIRIANYLI